MNYIGYLNRLKDIRAEIDGHIHSIALMEETISNLSYSNRESNSTLQQDAVMKLEDRKQQLKESTMELRREIQSLKIKEKAIRTSEPKIDRNIFLEQVRGELTQLDSLQEKFNSISNTFDKLFGSSKARTIIEGYIRDNTDYSNSSALDELMQLSSKIDVIDRSMERLNNIHNDSYRSMMMFVFPNIGTILHGADGRTLLLVYVLYYMIVLVLMLYYPVYTTLPLVVIMVLATIVNSKKYDNLINSFTEAYKILNIAQNAENIINQNIEAKMNEEKSFLKQKDNEKADKILDEIRDLDEQLKLKDLGINDELLKYEEELKQNIESRLDELKIMDEKNKKEILSFRDNIKSIREVISDLELSRVDVIDNIQKVSGLSKPVAQREEIFDPNFLIGLNDTMDDIVTVNVTEPLLINGSKEFKVQVANIIISQLFNRMSPPKIKIYIYDQENLGMDFITYTNKDYDQYGVNLITSTKEFTDFMKTLEDDIRQFKSTLPGFGNIHKYNEYMYKNNSVTREYILVMLFSLPKEINFSGYAENLGVHWIALSTPKNDSDSQRFFEVFRNTFKE